MAQICVTLIEETTAGLVDRMADLAGTADLFEVRGDMVLDLDLLTVLRAKTKPLVFACRPLSQGGRFQDNDTQRRMVLLEAVKRGFDYVDVELSSDFMDVMIEKSGSGLIVSHHDFEGTPADLRSVYDAACRKGADIVKLAVTPRSVADVAKLLEFASLVARGGGKPMIPIAMGPMGVLTRVLAGRYGAPFTFACAATGCEAAPGQLSVALMADLYRVRNVTAETRVYGVLGSDVARSFSPMLLNRAFDARRLDAVYVPLQAEALAPFIQALPVLDLAGFSVTRPYKVEILSQLQEVEESAALCGSVNTVLVQGGTLRGSTTDGLGVLAPLKRRGEIKGRNVVIVGAGGAARAAALALHRKGARVTVVARNPAQAAVVATQIGCRSAGLETLRALTWDVLVNATPVGSSGLPEESPVPASWHRPGTIVLDMVYEPLETRLLREAQAASCTTIGGLEMLVAQAAAQFETWTGLEAPADVMKSTALFLAQEHEQRERA
jgi:3-dehydroquinate dehydratase/shikimate dehydrogenase